MDSNPQFSLRRAKAAANDLAALLQPACRQIEVVGSVRRGVTVVHDLDIILIPRIELVKGGAGMLFQDIERSISSLDVAITQLVDSGAVELSKRGERLMSGTYMGEFPFDLYVATPESWHTLRLIRTGSAAHNIQLCTAARDRGMHLKADGSGIVGPDGILIHVRDERDVFRILGIAYREPAARV